jgi:hypothetical protein
MKVKKMIYTLMILMLSCNLNEVKPKLMYGHYIGKIDNEIIDDKTTNDLITIIFQIPNDFITLSFTNAFRSSERFLARRSPNFSIFGHEYSNWKGYFKLDSTVQINTVLKWPNGKEKNIERLSQKLMESFSAFRINSEYHEQILITKEYSQYKLKGYNGLIFRSKWLINETKDTLYNAFIYLFVEEYQFNATIDIINGKERENAELVDSFIESIWVKKEKNGRGYGN